MRWGREEEALEAAGESNLQLLGPASPTLLSTLTLGSAREAEHICNGPRDPLGGEPEDGLAAVPPDEDELGASRRDPDESAEAERKAGAGGCKRGV